MVQSDETYQIKELLSGGGFKFPDSPQNNKLMHLKDVHKWLLKIRHLFRHYSNFYMFLYATVAYIDTRVELQPRKRKETKVKDERDRVKAELLSEDDDEDELPEGKYEDSIKVSNSSVPEGLKTELRDFGIIATYEDLGRFMKATRFADPC